MRYHDNMMFSTESHDNDLLRANCAATFNPWWLSDCCTCILTAEYGPYPNVSERLGIKWWVVWDQETFAKYAVMMVRPNY